MCCLSLSTSLSVYFRLIKADWEVQLSDAYIELSQMPPNDDPYKTSGC